MKTKREIRKEIHRRFVKARKEEEYFENVVENRDCIERENTIVEKSCKMDTKEELGRKCSGNSWKLKKKKRKNLDREIVYK